MNTPTNSPEILALSIDAQALLAGHWMLFKKMKLNLNNQESVLSERSAAAMTELVDSGIIRNVKADNGYAESRTYLLSDVGANLEFRKSMAWVEKHGAFPLVVPKNSK